VNILRRKNQKRALSSARPQGIKKKARKGILLPSSQKEANKGKKELRSLQALTSKCWRKKFWREKSRDRNLKVVSEGEKNTKRLNVFRLINLKDIVEKTVAW